MAHALADVFLFEVVRRGGHFFPTSHASFCFFGLNVFDGAIRVEIGEKCNETLRGCFSFCIESKTVYSIYLEYLCKSYA